MIFDIQKIKIVICLVVSYMADNKERRRSRKILKKSLPDPENSVFINFVKSSEDNDFYVMFGGF